MKSEELTSTSNRCFLWNTSNDVKIGQMIYKVLHRKLSLTIEQHESHKNIDEH